MSCAIFGVFTFIDPPNDGPWGSCLAFVPIITVDISS